MEHKSKSTVADALPGFIEFLSVERRFSPGTIQKYEDNVRWFIRDVGNRAIADISRQDFISLKARMSARNAREARIASVICAMKSILCYARDILSVRVLDLTAIRVPRAARRSVAYLTNEELDQFIQAIPLRTWEGKERLAGYRLRALVETLASTGMRISEALSIDHEALNFEKGEATIIGKGNKERIVLFTPRSLEWVRRYLDLRSDNNPALFVTNTGVRLQKSGAEAMFRRTARWAGLQKPVTPHIIRHTTATNLLRNGCPIGFIKEVLGHQRLETTCRFYLGILSAADTKKAHGTFLNLEVGNKADFQVAESRGLTALH